MSSEGLVNWKQRLLVTVDYLYNGQIIPLMAVYTLSCPYSMSSNVSKVICTLQMVTMRIANPI